MKLPLLASAVDVFYRHLMVRERLAIAAYFLLLLTAIGLQVPMPFLLSALIDALSHGAASASLAKPMMTIIALSLAATLLSIVTQIYGARLNMRFLLGARLAVYRALQHAPLRFARSFNVTDLHARLLADTAVLQHFLPTGIANVARHATAVVVFGVLLIYISPAVVLFIVWLLPVAAAMFFRAKPRLAQLSASAHVSNAQSSAAVLESLMGLRECKITGSEDFQHESLRRALKAGEHSVLRVRTYSARMFGALSVIPIVVTATIWLVGGWQVHAGSLSLGQLLSFMLVLSLMYGPINGLFGVASGYVYEREAFERVAVLYTGAVAAAAPGAGRVRSHGAAGADGLRIDCHNLGFGYGDGAVFAGFNAAVPAGACVSVVGANGSGKSTLVSMLCGFEAPTSGVLAIDGVPLDLLEADYQSRHFGYLPQDTLIFGGALRTNITMGRDLGDAQVLAAFGALGLDDFLAEWPQGLDSVIAERGRNLSGGQRQKIALLRAIVNRPALLILDEPENNLDADAIGGLARYLAGIKGRCTVLLVSHGQAFGALVDLTLDMSGAALPAPPPVTG